MQKARHADKESMAILITLVSIAGFVGYLTTAFGLILFGPWWAALIGGTLLAVMVVVGASLARLLDDGCCRRGIYCFVRDVILRMLSFTWIGCDRS